MSLPEDHLRYPLRRYGMDHGRYDWSMLHRRPPVSWPHEARVALWVVPALEWFPLSALPERAATINGVSPSRSVAFGLAPA